MPGERGNEDAFSIIHRNFLRSLLLIIIIARKNDPRPQFPDDAIFTDLVTESRFTRGINTS